MEKKYFCERNEIFLWRIFSPENSHRHIIGIGIGKFCKKCSPLKKSTTTKFLFAPKNYQWMSYWRTQWVIETACRCLKILENKMKIFPTAYSRNIFELSWPIRPIPLSPARYSSQQPKFYLDPDLVKPLNSTDVDPAYSHPDPRSSFWYFGSGSNLNLHW